MIRLPRDHRRVRFVPALALLWILSGCQSAGPGPTPVVATVSPAPTTAAAPTDDATISAEPAASDALTVDGSLLAILPATVSGVAMEADPETAATLVDDPDLGASASAVAIAIYVGADPSGEDLAIVTVTQLRPGIFGPEFYDTWRHDVDESACEPAGGVSGTTARTIASFDVDLASCAEGLSSYHVHLDGDRLVSIVGSPALAEAVIAGITP